MSPIQNFYRDRVVLITGVTGFLGKVLLYKLLVACPDIKRIIVLLRSKHGESCSERLHNLLSKPQFSGICKNTLNKVSYLSVDLLKPNLGLSSKDQVHLFESEVTVVFHLAASVRFIDNLDVALRSNTLPTLHLLNICHKIPNLQAFVYVSTAFSNFPYKVINEEVYPIDVDLHQITDIKGLDMKYLEAFCKEKCWPNTYTFSKALAENGLQQNNKSLPLAILRPSIVLNSWKDPTPGWIDNVNGSTKLIADIYLGTVKTILCNSRLTADIIPVDVCINSLLAVAWETAKYAERGQCKVYNCVSSVQNPITWGQYIYISTQQMDEFSSNKTHQYHTCKMTRHHFIFFLLWFILTFIPACFLFILGFFKSSDSYGMLRAAISSLRYNLLVSDFGLKEIEFKDSNLRDLLDKLTPKDHNNFSFDVRQIKWTEYLTECIKGLHQYILEEGFNTLHSARK